MEQWKRAIFPLVLLFAALMFDGIGAALLREQFQSNMGLMVPRLTLLCLIILSFYLKPSHITTLSLVFGFIYDSYYTGYLGIYMASFVFVGYLMMQLRPMFHANVLIYVLLSVIVITIVEFFLYGVYRTLGIAMITPQAFIAERLGATLLLNSVMMLVLSWPLDRFAQFIVRTDERKYRQSF
jgi:rod shape-determining protein MreD